MTDLYHDVFLSGLVLGRSMSGNQLAIQKQISMKTSTNLLVSTGVQVDGKIGKAKMLKM